MGYCDAGRHPSLSAFEYGGTKWCPEHLPPGGPIDPPSPGVCGVGRPHKADHVYWVSVMGKRACRRHFAIIVREVIRRSSYGSR